MSLLLATALLAAPATLPSCSWDRPGVNPFVGDVVAAVDRYTDIPPDVRGKLKARMAQRQYDEIASITRDAITGKARYEAAIRGMHFGAGQVCNTVTRDRWNSSHQERGLVYCESGHCIIVPTVCRNVSRITRLESRADAVEALPVEEQLADRAADEAPLVTAGGDADDEALPRLRSGGTFGGMFAPGSGSPLAGGSRGAPQPEGFGPRLASAVGSVVSSVKKAVRDVVELVTSLPVFRADEPQGAVPAPAVAPATPGTNDVPDTVLAADTPGTAPAPAAPAGNGPAPSPGGSTGTSADPASTAGADPAPAAPGLGGTGDGLPGAGAGEGSGSGSDTRIDTRIDLVDDLVELVEQGLDEQGPADPAPGSDVPVDLGGGGGSVPGGGLGGGGTGGGRTDSIVPQGGGELPEPATPALVLVAGLAAALAARRRLR